MINKKTTLIKSRANKTPLPRTLDDALVRVIVKWLLDEKATNEINDASKKYWPGVKFWFAMLGGVIFMVFVLFGIAEEYADKISSRFPPTLMPFLYIIISVVLIIFAHMINHVKKIGRVRAYLLGLALPVITISIIAKAIDVLQRLLQG